MPMFSDIGKESRVHIDRYNPDGLKTLEILLEYVFKENMETLRRSNVRTILRRGSWR